MSESDYEYEQTVLQYVMEESVKLHSKEESVEESSVEESVKIQFATKLEARRTLLQEQDDEYEKSLEMDRVKKLKSCEKEFEENEKKVEIVNVDKKVLTVEEVRKARLDYFCKVKNMD